MTTLMPAVSACVSRRLSGERRTAERLAQKHVANRLPGNDEAQRIHHRTQKRPLSCKGVGIQANGRTTFLKINCRSMRQTLQIATAHRPPPTAHRDGHAWGDLVILCRHHSEMDMCAEFLRKRKLPHQLRRKSSSVFDPAHDSIKVMTLHVSKGLEFPVVALVGAGRMPAEGEDEREETRLFYVGATRATQRLVIGASGGGAFGRRIQEAKT